MKKLAAAASLTIIASTANAGGLSDPIVEPIMAPTVIVEEAAASSMPSPYLVIGLAFVVVAAAAASH